MKKGFVRTTAEQLFGVLSWTFRECKNFNIVGCKLINGNIIKDIWYVTPDINKETRVEIEQSGDSFVARIFRVDGTVKTFEIGQKTYVSWKKLLRLAKYLLRFGEGYKTLVRAIVSAHNKFCRQTKVVIEGKIYNINVAALSMAKFCAGRTEKDIEVSVEIQETKFYHFVKAMYVKINNVLYRVGLVKNVITDECRIAKAQVVERIPRHVYTASVPGAFTLEV